MALTNWNDILNKPNGIDEVPEIALTVEQLSASVLSLGEDVGEIAGDVQEIALEISQLSASTLPYNSEETIKEAIDTIGTVDHAANDVFMNVNDTWQIPADIWKHNFIVVSVRRYGIGGFVIIQKDEISAYDNSISIPVYENDFYSFKVSATGLFTLSRITTNLGAAAVQMWGFL